MITDVAGNGIEIGDASAFDTNGNSLAPTAIESADTVSDNYIHDVANQYMGGVGIVAGWVTGTTIDHNDVSDTPYTGISLGWGWGQQSSAYMSGNHVDDNYVHDVMTSSTSDGGGIYLNGTQGSAGSTLDGNYISQVSRAIGALYLDNGSSYWQVENNAVGNYAPNWLYVQQYAPTADHDTVENNYAWTSAGGINGTPPSDNTVQNNTSGLTSWPAGRRPPSPTLDSSPHTSGCSAAPRPRTSTTRRPTRSQAPGPRASPGRTRTARPSAPRGPRRAATRARTGRPTSGPHHTLSDIQIDFRMDGYDYPTEREGFEITVSNSSSVTSGLTVACSQGNHRLPYESRYDCPAPAGTWRYVSVIKTDGNPEVLGQVRVFGAQDHNVALGATATSLSLYSGSFPPANAVDGNIGTIFASSTGTGQWWEAALPQQYTLSQAQIVFRSDGYDYSTERQNLEVVLSKNANLSPGTVACTLGATPLPYASTYSCPLPAGPWQYVQVLKTDGEPMVLAEVRVWGH